MRLTDRIPVDFTDLLRGLNVIQAETGAARAAAIRVMIREVSSLAACTARDDFLVDLETALLSDDASRLGESFLRMTCVFAGWGMAAWLEREQRADHVANGKKGGREADAEVHRHRAKDVERALLRNPRLSQSAACREVAASHGVTESVIRRSLKIVRQ